VTVSVGQSLSSAKELHTVHIAPSDTKVMLLQNLASEQRFVQIDIKACRSGGIDCKVRYLNIIGLVKADEDELAASFQYLAVQDHVDDDTAVEVKGKGSTQLSRDELGQSRRRDRRLAGERVTVFVWGLNDKDQLGGLRGSKIRSPTLSDVLSRLNIVQLAGGSKCLIAVTRDGKVYCCGENVSGRLGLSHSNNVHMVQQVQSLSQYVMKKVAIHSSGRHALALTADGKVFSWGEGDDGKLGHGNRV
jgi:E3 ubiquitin-protein ligase HERC2